MRSPKDIIAQRIIREHAARLRSADGSASADRVYQSVLDAIGSKDGQLIGHLRGGTPVTLSASTIFRHALIEGNSGAGKTYFVSGIITGLQVIKNELVVIDPKNETIVLIRAALSRAIERNILLRRELEGACLLVEANETRLTPTAPFRRIAGVSDAFLAEQRTAMFVGASTDPISGAMREVIRNLFEIAIACEAPYSCVLFARLLDDAAFRGWVAERVAPHLRAFLEGVERLFSHQTLEAVARRIRAFASYPLIRLSYGVPPGEFVRLAIPLFPRIVLGDYGPNLSVPFSIATTRAAWAVTDALLLAASRPRDSRPRLIVLEELPALLTAAPDLVPLVLHASRTARASNISLLAVGQSFQGLPRVVRDELELNALWCVSFQTSAGGFAETIAAHLRTPDGRLAPLPVVKRLLATLPPRHALLTVKSVGAVPIVAADLDLPRGAALSGLAESFASLGAGVIPARRAEELLTSWEQAFVHSTAHATKKKTGARDLLGLRGDE